MFQPPRECIDSLAIDDIAGQAVPESESGRTEWSVADSCMPHPRYLQSMCPRWPQPMPARHISYTRSSTKYCGVNPFNDLKINIASLNCMRSDAHS